MPWERNKEEIFIDIYSEQTTWEVAGDVQTPPHWSGTLDLESDKPRRTLHYITLKIVTATVYVF